MNNSTRIKIPKKHANKISTLFKRFDNFENKIVYVAMVSDDYRLQHKTRYVIEARTQSELLKTLRTL